MIANLSLLLICQLIGEVIVRWLRIPVPGPVVGLLVLFFFLLLRDRYGFLAWGPLGDGGVEGTSKGLLQHLSLMFVPAGVGVVQQLNLVTQHGLAIFLVLAASALVTLLVTAGTFLLASKLLARGKRSS